MSKDSIERAVRRRLAVTPKTTMRFATRAMVGRRRRHRRGADRQPQPRGLRYPVLLHQIRRQFRRNRFGRLHVSTTPASSNTTPRSPPTMRCWMRRSRPAPTTCCRARTATRSTPRRRHLSRRHAKALEAEFRRSPQGAALDLETAEHRSGRRRDRREAASADRSVERTRRRAKRVCEFPEVSTALMTKMGG